MKKLIKYDLIGAHKSQISKHPQKDVADLGMKIISSESVPIADCIIMEVDKIPDAVQLPTYIEILV